MRGLIRIDWNRRAVASVVAIFMLLGPFLQIANAADSDSGVVELSLQDAVDLAMKNNDDIKSAELNKENTSLTRSIGQKEYAQSIVNGPAYNTFTQDQTLNTQKINDLNYDIASLTYDYTKEAVEVAVQQAYWNVLLQQSAIETAQSDLEYAEAQYRSEQLKQTVGMLTQTSVEQAKATVESAKSALTSAEGNLETALDSLRKLIGLKEGTELLLTEELPEYTPIEISDLEYYVNKMVMNAPTLKIQDLNVEVADYTGENTKLGILSNILETSTNGTTTGGVTYSQEDQEDQAEIGIESARLTKETTEKNLKETVRSLYYNALALEAQYESLQQTMLTAQSNLETQQQMYELGMVTSLEVLAAENTCASYEDQYKQLVINHAITALQLEHPWV